MINPLRTHPATLTTQSLQCPSAIGHRTTLRSTQQIILCRIQTYFQQTRCRIIFPSKNMSLVNSLCIRGGALNQVPINITLNIKPNKRHHLIELFDAGQTVQSTAFKDQQPTCTKTPLESERPQWFHQSSISTSFEMIPDGEYLAGFTKSDFD